MMTTKVCIQEAISLSGNVLTADTVYDTKYWLLTLCMTPSTDCWHCVWHQVPTADTVYDTKYRLLTLCMTPSTDCWHYVWHQVLTADTMYDTKYCWWHIPKPQTWPLIYSLLLIFLFLLLDIYYILFYTISLYLFIHFHDPLPNFATTDNTQFA
jgi:hypothetical protein